MRSALLTVASLAMTAVVVGNAYHQRQQFYPTVVYITKSNSSMAVIYLQALVVVGLFGQLMKKVFFGRLRAAEFEHLMERSWYAVTETCLAFTLFKDDFSPKFVALFTLLLFLKSFHWLAEDRVDFMERSPSVSLVFHARIISLAALLATLDCYFVGYAYHQTLGKGPSVQLVFGFEYAILLTIVLNTVAKYLLHSVDLRLEHPWEGKAVCMLYSELVLGFVKLLFHILFVVIMIRIYTLPLFAVRPMYVALRTFKKAFNDVVLSRRAIHNMNTSYPDATPEELAAADNICIICREEMLAPSTKKLPCNHIFHKACLRSWFQRQQTCPTCRLDVLRAPPQPRQQEEAPPPQPQPQQQQQQQQQLPPFPMPFYHPQMFARMMNPAAAGPTASTSAPAPPPLPPLPPFAFPPPPFGVPPPMPPPNFSGMTDEELAQLEGAERANVEARVKCLRNIQVLLDAAVLEMQQYSSVVCRMNESTASQQPQQQETGTKPKVKTEGGAALDKEKEEIIAKMDEGDAAEAKKSSPELNEVRRRWQGKFDQQANGADGGGGGSSE